MMKVSNQKITERFDSRAIDEQMTMVMVRSCFQDVSRPKYLECSNTGTSKKTSLAGDAKRDLVENY